MSEIKQEGLTADYDYANQAVNFTNNKGEIRMSLPMSVIMEISNDIRPVYSLMSTDAIKRTVTVSYVPVENNIDV